MNLEKLRSLAKNFPDLLASCNLCPHRCSVNRLNGELGVCSAGEEIAVYSYLLHKGEEPPLSGCNGSGTIFFSNCQGRCVYCQNYKFSQRGVGKKKTVKELAEIMCYLQKQGAHNINLVTPTHYVPQIMAALDLAVADGLTIPIVYNSNGYELPGTLELLAGIVDIYLPDIRYSNNEFAVKYSALPDYVAFNREAIKIMYQQVGNLIVEGGIAKRGLIIRHLVLPNGISGTEAALCFIKQEVSSETAVSMMSQYCPVFRAGEFPELNRVITGSEYETILSLMDSYGIVNGWRQENLNNEDRNIFLGTNFMDQ